MDKTILKIMTILLLVAGLHVGLYGAFGLDLLGTIFGTGTLAKVVYIFVGISAVYHLFHDVTKKLVK